VKAGAKQFFVFWRPLPLLWAAVSLINPVFMTCFLHKAPESLARFLGATMLLPLGAGMTLALIAGRVIHQPAVMLLPGARRFYQRAFLWMAVAVGGGLVGFAVWTTANALPVGSVAALVFLCLSVGLLWEPLSRWWGSTWLLALVTLAMCVAGIFVVEIRELVAGNPGWFLAAAAAAFFLMSRVIFAKERVRERAMTVMMLCGADLKTLSRVGLARKKWVAQDWTRGAVAATDERGWLAAFSHEWFGAMSWPRIVVLMLWLVGVWAMVALGVVASHVKLTQQTLSSAALSREFFALVWSVGSERSGVPILPFVTCAAALFLFPFVLTYPRMTALYPISRRMFARLVMRMTMRQTIAQVGIVLAMTLLVAWLATVLAGETFRWRASSMLAVPLALLPVLPWIAGLMLPLSQWMTNPGRGLLTRYGLLLAAGWLAGLASACVLSFFAAQLLTWPGVVCVVIAMLPGWCWLRNRVNRFYLLSDLVARERM